MKKIFYILTFAAIISLGCGLCGCQKSMEPIEPEPGQESNTVLLGVQGIDANAMQKSAASRAAGSIMDGVDDFGSENVALYGVVNLFSNNTQQWATAQRVISTATATIAADGKINYGTPVKYPVGGYLDIYALYPALPATNDYLVVTDDGTKAPSAVINLKANSKDQYDVLHSVRTGLTMAQSQKANITFTHALAQLKFKIYKESNDITARVSRITVSGVSKASMDDIRQAKFTPSTVAADSLDFVVYDQSGSATPVTATSSETATPIGGQLILLPGVKSVRTIIATIDGNNYITLIPKTWDLAQGKINTITLRVNKLGVRLENPWIVSPWAVGTNDDQNLENNGKMISIKTLLQNAEGTVKSPYTGIAPDKMDITVRGYCHRAVGVTVSGGVLSSDEFNSGSLNNEPIYVEGITLYNGSTKLFDAQLQGGTMVKGQRIFVDTQNNGELKINDNAGAALNLSMTFGGIGNGDQAMPYEISTVAQLEKVRTFIGNDALNNTPYNGTTARGACFAQVKDIDMAQVANFIPIGNNNQAFFGSYDGGGKTIKNLTINNTANNTYTGLWGSVNSKSGVTSMIQNIVLINSNVSGINYTGSIVGNLQNSSTVKNCSAWGSVAGSGSDIGAATGGIVGQTTRNATISGCANFANITSNNDNLGGLVGVLASGAQITDSYNAGTVNYTGNSTEHSVGGLVAYVATNNSAIVQNCYNRAIVTGMAGSTNTGALIGWTNGSRAVDANFTNNYFLSGSQEKGVGKTSAIDDMTSRVKVKNQTELKALAPVLGAAWQNDISGASINQGFPILTWQK